MSDYEAYGQVTKVDWLTWTTGLEERFPVSVGDIVRVDLQHSLLKDQQTSELIEFLRYKIGIGGLGWVSDASFYSTNVCLDPDCASFFTRMWA